MKKEILTVAAMVFGFIVCVLGFFIVIPLLFNLHSTVGLLGIIAVLAMIGAYVSVVVINNSNKGN